MGKQEIILNLWCMIDGKGLIYSVRARCYIHTGTDDEKLAFLRSLAEIDWLIAQSFPVPKRFHITEDEGEKERTLPIASYAGIRATVPFISLFEEVIVEMDSQLSPLSKLRIGQQPVVCMTPVLGDDDGNLRPLTDNVEWHFGGTTW